MQIGGVILGAGMVLDLHAGDYLTGAGPLRFVVERILGTRQQDSAEWVVLTGVEQPTPVSAWRTRHLLVRVSALSRCLVLA